MVVAGTYQDSLWTAAVVGLNAMRTEMNKFSGPFRLVCKRLELLSDIGQIRAPGSSTQPESLSFSLLTSRRIIFRLWARSRVDSRYFLKTIANYNV